jgi:hypothetical protein
MPYDSIDAARKAGFPTSLDDIDMTLAQINKLAEIHDAIKKAGSAYNPMAVAWDQWRAQYRKAHTKWIEQSGAQNIPDGLEAATLSFGSLDKITEDPNGDTIFHDVTLLAEGTWTDGHSKQATRYTGSELEKMHIEKTTMKMDHDIFGKLPITNEIGLIENPKFVRDPIAKWLGDVRIFPTQNGKDTTTLLKRGKITDISSELFLKPVINSQTKVADATNMVFMGAATVRQGACTVCKFNEGITMVETPIEPAAGGNEPVTAPVIDKAPDIVALEAQITERENALASQTAGELKMAHDKIVELEASVVALKAQMEASDHDVKVRELQKKYEALSKQPVIHTVVSGAPAPAQAAVELDTGDFEAFSAFDFTED